MMDSHRTEERKPRRHALKGPAKKNAKSSLPRGGLKKEARLEISEPQEGWASIFLKEHQRRQEALSTKLGRKHHKGTGFRARRLSTRGFHFPAGLVMSVSVHFLASGGFCCERKGS